jgi:hypothetical protein
LTDALQLAHLMHNGRFRLSVGFDSHKQVPFLLRYSGD